MSIVKMLWAYIEEFLYKLFHFWPQKQTQLKVYLLNLLDSNNP